MVEVERRRRRLRYQPAESPGDDGHRSANPAATYDPMPQDRPRGAIPIEEREGERSLRGLIGSGSSQVSLDAALRARDAARPSETDLAEAERRVALVRRNWVSREELPRSGPVVR